MTETAVKPDLLPADVTDELHGWLAAFPLPEGLDDADMNQAEIGQALGASVNTVGKWIQSGMPVVQRGGNGQAYVLRLSHCWAWRAAQQEEEAARARHNKNQIARMQAHLLGLNIGDDGAQMTAKQRRETAEADLLWSKAARERRQLVQLPEVIDLLESICKIVRDGIEGMPDRLERELGLKPEQVRATRRVGDDILNKIVETIEEAELQERDVPDVEVQDQWQI